MITREEFDRKYFTAKSQSAKNEACLEYINSLEAQLTNTEQLTCDGCIKNGSHTNYGKYCCCNRNPNGDLYDGRKHER